MARRTAERQSARIPWPRLYEARKEYLTWEAFVFWVRSIEEAEGGAPEWLAKAVRKRCPDFSEFLEEKKEDRRDDLRFLWYKVQRWVNGRIFGKIWEQGWMTAIGFYAARDLASHRNHGYWLYCEREWPHTKPANYPSFREWLKASEHCDDEVLDQCDMREEQRELIKLMRRVTPQTLRRAIERYVDWEVFAYWTRTALEDHSPLPAAVEIDLKRKCPGFLKADVAARAASPGEERQCRFNRMVEWIEAHEFTKVRKGGWFDVLLYQARLHPRHMRVIDYWHDWKADWAKHRSAKYPSFKNWRDAADSYTFDSGEA
ncbi:MAG: hypothetical protein M1423_06020 [Acidobacteria bacterium]|nr:hypothetical protein [Acidobacteriota bacterium]